MISINLILLISTIVCLLCCCVFTILSVWTYFKGKSTNNIDDDDDLIDQDIKDKKMKEKNAKDDKKSKQSGKPGKSHDDDSDDDDDDDDSPEKRRGMRWYIIMAVVTFVFTIGLGIAYWFTRERTDDNLEVKPPPSPEEVAREQARQAMIKISRDYDTLESEITSESNDGLNAVRLIEKYSRNITK